MQIKTDLGRRIENIDLAADRSHVPIVEAIVNSIEATAAPAIPWVEVEVYRQQALDVDGKSGAVTAVEIRDQGVGLTPANYESFCTLDSNHKKERGGKGIGRLTWLKVFESVSVDSRFGSGEKKMQRSFVFDRSGRIDGDKVVVTNESTGTIVRMSDPTPKYRPTFPTAGIKLAEKILDELVAYYLGNQPPSIVVLDQGTEIDLSSLLSKRESLDDRDFIVRESTFRLRSLKLRGKSATGHRLCFLAHNRTVLTSDLRKSIIDLDGSVADELGEFEFVATVSGDYLDENVSASRHRYELPSSLFGPSLDDIRDAAVFEIRLILASELGSIRSEKVAKAESVVSTLAPQYRKFLADEEVANELNPKWAEEDILRHLRKTHFERATSIREEAIKFLAEQPDPVDAEAYRARFDELAEQIGEAGQRELAEYVVHRKVVLDLLSRALKISSDDGSYLKESAVHNLIAPMGRDSSSIDAGALNVWVVDDRLAFHRYLSSNRTLKKTPIGGDSNLRPDILVLSPCDVPTSTIAIVELKRPMTTDKGLLDEVFRVRNEIMTQACKAEDGRPIATSDPEPRFFVYIIVDSTVAYDTFFKDEDFARTQNGGWTKYYSTRRTLVEVRSFDSLLLDAQQRNQAFIEILG